MKRNMLTAVLMLGLASQAWGQELDLSFLKDLEAKAAEATNISLGKEQLQLIQGLTGSVAGELKSLAGGIEMVQVKVLEFEQAGMFKMADMQALKDKLKGSDMVPIISVKERNGFTEIMLRKGPKGNRGFVILSAEPKELTVVNIVGDLDLASLGKLSGKFGIPDLVLQQGGKSNNPKVEGGQGKKEEDEN